VAFASAWAALSNGGFEENSQGKWVRKRKPDDSEETSKRQLTDDVFTTEQEARARSEALGFAGAIHTHETADGQKVYMPGASHEQYLQGAEQGEPPSPEAPPKRRGPLGRLMQAIGELLSRDEDDVERSMDEHEATSQNGVIVKADEEQRIVYGWASVVTKDGEAVVDKQGDMIAPDEMEKMATEFMMSARKAKAMHEGEGIGEVIHSMPLTDTIAKAFGVESSREGWMIAMKVHDDEVWQRVKRGDLRAFSIGGEAMSDDA
jgi:hypothetical protein